MEDIIAPISKELLKAELTEESDIYYYSSGFTQYDEGNRTSA